MKLRWRCAEGHEWSATPNAIRKAWCPSCGGLTKWTIEMMQELARARGGECLSRHYAGLDIHLRWRCEKGHEWEAVPAVIRRGGWCAICVTARRMERTAERRRPRLGEV